MGTETFKQTNVTKSRLWQIIGPGHYRPVSFEFGSIPQFTITHPTVFGIDFSEEEITK